MSRRETGGPPFVGRVEESAALDDALGAASDGQFVCLIVSGESGIGKTELVRRFAERAAGGGTGVTWVSCREFGRSPPLWPWTQVMRSIGEDAIGASWLDARPEDPFMVIDGFTEALRRRTTAPRLVVLDDLHHADLGTLEVLRHLCSGRFELPLLVVAMVRAGGREGDDVRDIAFADIDRRARRVGLSGLARREVGDLIDAIVGPRPGMSSDGLIDTIMDRSGGNPLYASALLETARGRSTDAIGSIPTGVRALVRERLSNLPEASRHALAVGALQGRQFDPGVIAAVADDGTPDIQALLSPAVDTGIVEHHGERYRFRHLIVAELLRDELPPDDTRRLHLRLAGVFERTGSPLVPALARSSLVAAHLVEAGSLVAPADVAMWFERAVKDARHVRSYADAATFGDAAAKHWRYAGDVEREAVALNRVVEDHLAAGSGAAAVARANELAALARRLDSGDLLARAALARSQVFDAAQEVDGVELLREALDHPDNAAAIERRAQLLAQLASILGMPSYSGLPQDPIGSRYAIDELREMSTGKDGSRVHTALALAQLNVMSGPAHFEDRQRWFHEGVVARSSDRLFDQLERAYWATSLAYERADLAGVATEVEKWISLAERSGDTYWRWRATMARAGLLYLHGEFEAAASLAVTSLPLVVNLYPEMAFRVCAGLLFAIRRDQGRLATLAEELTDLAGQHRGFAERLSGHGLAALSPLVSLDAGDVDAARSSLPPIVAVAKSMQDDELIWMCMMTLVATCAAEVGDGETCGWAVQRLAPYRRQFAMWGRSYVPGGPVALSLGGAYRTCGDVENAASCFRETIEWADRADAPAFGARARVELADLLDDEATIRMLRSSALDTARSIGMVGLANHVAALLGASVPTDADSSSRLRATVRVLGRFEVVPAGGQAPARWSSRKARDALKLLVCQRGRSIPREQLIDHLWPEATVATGRSRLSVVLSMVRSALDPDRQLEFDPVVGDRQAVALDLDVVSVDAEELLRDVQLARDRRRKGDAAEALQVLRAAVERAGTPDVFSDDPYSDWSASFRHEVGRAFRDAMHMLAELAEEAGEPDEAAHWEARLVESSVDGSLP